jgi:hypothetical protein
MMERDFAIEFTKEAIDGLKKFIDIDETNR